MKRKVLFFSALVLTALLTTPAAAEQGDSDCYVCHEELKKSFASGTVHAPVADGDCGSCHEDHGSQNTLALTEEVPQLCWGCHDELTEAYKHEPAGEGSCLDCHGVHNSEYDSLLSETVPNLCNGCHDPFGDQKSVHKPVARGECLSCHSSHQSAQAALLVKDQTDLCADCHEDADHSKGKFPHEPVAGGDCSECHLSHVSEEAALLSSRYNNSNRYAPYSGEEYALCFNCHEKAVFESPEPDQTEFRNGEVNLHYLHVIGREQINRYGMKVGRKEGMTCMGCHLAHGTDQAKLVRANLECGPTYCYTMSYRKFEGGGTCVVGCHKPKVYRQEIPLADDAAGHMAKGDQQVEPAASRP